MYIVTVAFSTAPTVIKRVAPSDLGEAIRLALAMGATAVQAELD